MQQAITARTGQAFIDGQTSNEAQFKYLMNNAIASKQALNLSVGVGLTSEQVAALTHDIVWLETHEVNGENVLVYLAQANGRLGPTGALIAGNAATLIPGPNLYGPGTFIFSQKNYSFLDPCGYTDCYLRLAPCKAPKAASSRKVGDGV